MKYIYLIGNTENGHYKIGVSSNPNKRIKQLQTGNSSKLDLIKSIICHNAFEVESILHRTYNKIDGEWFDLNLTEVSNFEKECNKIIENLQILSESNLWYINSKKK